MSIDSLGKRKSRELWLSALDVLHLVFHVRDRFVTAFALQYTAIIRGTRVEVLGYDTHHGHLHAHRFWRADENHIKSLEPRSPPSANSSRTLHNLLADLVDTWPEYRTRMEGTMMP